MSEHLSELEKVLALLDKATGGELFILWIRSGSIKYPVATTKDRNIFIEASSHQKADDCRAIIGAINFLREHGPAIAAALRAVEGAATGRVDMLCARDAVVVDEIAEDRMLALHKQRVALVPLDAAGSAEGV